MANKIYSTKKRLGFFSLNNKITLNGDKILFPLDEEIMSMAEWIVDKYGVKYNKAVSLIVKKTLWIKVSIVYDWTNHPIINTIYNEGRDIDYINEISDKDISDILWDIGGGFQYGWVWCYPSRKEVEMGKILDE